MLQHGSAVFGSGFVRLRATCKITFQVDSWVAGLAVCAVFSFLLRCLVGVLCVCRDLAHFSEDMLADLSLVFEVGTGFYEEGALTRMFRLLRFTVRNLFTGFVS